MPQPKDNIRYISIINLCTYVSHENGNNFDYLDFPDFGILEKLRFTLLSNNKEEN